MKTTIQHVIDSLIEPVGLLDETVDSLYFGDPNAIPLLEKENLDLIIYGGGPEWKHRNIFGMPHGRAEQRR